MSLPDLEGLRAFLAAAHHLNFRAAAAEVGCSSTAFSERIARLEEAIETRLFERTTRRVELTAAGHRLRPRAEALLVAARGLRAAADAAGPVPYTLRLGTRFELGLSFLVPALDALEAARPERSLHLVFGVGPSLVTALEAGQLDALVTSARLTSAALDSAPLHPEHYALVAAPALLTARPLRRPTDAVAHRLLDLRADLPLFRYFLDARPPHEAWRFGRQQLLGTIAAVRARALAGAGVAVLPRYFVAPDLAAGTLMEPLPDTPLPVDLFRLVWRQGHPLADALRALAVELAARPLT